MIECEAYAAGPVNSPGDSLGGDVRHGHQRGVGDAQVPVRDAPVDGELERALEEALTRLGPVDAVERMVFELLEQYRAESLVPDVLPGARRNLRHAFAVDPARAAVLRLRAGKGMVLDAADHDTWSAGSFFTNPVVPDDKLPAVLAAIAEQLGDVTVPQFPGSGGTKLSAGWLIERAGFSKGYPGEDAPARLSTKHTLALTNRGSATSADVVSLARAVRDAQGEHGLHLSCPCQSKNLEVLPMTGQNVQRVGADGACRP